MPKSYTTIASTTYTGSYKASNDVAIPGSNFAVIQVNIHQEGRVTGLTVVNTDGSNPAFKAELLDSVTPFTVGNHNNSALTSPASPINLYRVIGQQTGASGILEFRQDCGQVFMNVDGNPTIPQPYLYLYIEPTAASGQTTWAFSLTIEYDIR